jgi:hypothetical protein
MSFQLEGYAEVAANTDSFRICFEKILVLLSL